LGGKIMARMHSNLSSAYKLEQPYYNYNVPQHEQEKDYAERRKKLKVVPKTKTMNPQVIMLLLVLFISLFFVVFRYVEINEANITLNTYKSEYNNLISENDQIQISIDRSIDLKHVEEIAKNKLGMQSPEKYQIIYVNINKNDYAEIPYLRAERAEKGNVIKLIANKITNVLEYLY
jgi:cell division protein FtsL